jgi:hypothetical protein
MALRVIGVGLGAEAVAPSGWELKADRPVGGLGDANAGCGTGTLGEVPAASAIDPFSACSRAAFISSGIVHFDCFVTLL